MYTPRVVARPGIRLQKRGTHPTVGTPLAGSGARYVRHLFWCNEILGHRLLTWHNLHVYLGLMRQARAAIEAVVFEEFQREFVAQYMEKIEND